MKYALINLLTSAVPLWLLKRSLPQKFIVYGHLVTDKIYSVLNYYRYPSIKDFDSFVTKFKALGYKFVDLSEYLNEDNQRKILVSFDDGFRSIYDDLHPYMVQKKIPYMLFIMTEPFKDQDFYINSIKPLSGVLDRQFLSVEEVLDLKRQNVHIGFHTTNHVKIEAHAQINSNELKKQLTIPKEYLHLFSQPLCFAYPYLAPENYPSFDEHLNSLGFDLLFDTKGFNSRENNHFFRVSIDAEKEILRKNMVEFVLKRQLMYYIIDKIKASI